MHAGIEEGVPAPYHSLRPEGSGLKSHLLTNLGSIWEGVINLHGQNPYEVIWVLMMMVRIPKSSYGC